MKKKLLTSFTLLILVLGLTNICLSKVTIQYWQTQLSELDKQMISDFEKQFPDIKIQAEGIPAGNMHEKVMTAIAAGVPPDVLYDYIGRLGNWWTAGALQSLNGTLSQEDAEDFYPSVLKLFSMDGNLIAYPQPFGVRTYGVNKTILEKAGVANLLPQGINREMTIDTWMQIAEKVSALPGIYATSFFCANPSGDYYMLGYFQGFGGYLYQNGDYTKTTLNSEGGIKALEWMIDLVNKGYAMPGVAGTTDDHHVAHFYSGKIAFGGWFPTPEQAKANYEQGAIDYLAEYYLLEYPHLKEIAPPPIYAGPGGISVFKNTKNREAAIQFAQFWTNKENTKRRIGKTFLLSTRKSVLPWQGSDIPTLLQNIISKNGIGDLGLTSPFYLQVRDLQCSALQAAFSGMKTPQEALDDFAKAVAELWKK